MIRVLHMIGSLNIGGSQALIMNIYRKIDKDFIQFDFIVDHDEQLFFAEEIQSLGGRVFILPGFNGRNLFEVKRAWHNFFLNHPEYYILHSHVRSYAAVFIPIAKKYGIYTIIHSHSTSNGEGLVSIAKTIMQYPLRYQADFFFGCSRESGEWLFGKKVIKSKKYFTFQNAIDIERFQFNRDIREYYRKSLDIGNERVFIHIGRLHPSKNHDFLLTLFSKWIVCNPKDKLILVGDGILRNEIQKRINELNLSNSVIMLGNRNDVEKLLQVADCFLFPSLWEGLPVTVVEAQAAGIPCLISSSITDEVLISKLVVKLPVDNGTNPWIEKMNELDYQRVNVSEDIVNAGFDINTKVKWITDFYNSLNREKYGEIHFTFR